MQLSSNYTNNIDCDFKLGHPLRQWLVGLGDSRLTRLNLYGIKLLVGCAGLEQDTARFRDRHFHCRESGM